MDTTPPLTSRERVILAHLALPLTLGEIASSLYVTRNTVKSQVRSIYLKLGVTDRVSALAEGQSRGLIPEDLGGPPTPGERPQLVHARTPSAQTSRR